MIYSGVQLLLLFQYCRAGDNFFIYSWEPMKIRNEHARELVTTRIVCAWRV